MLVACGVLGPTAVALAAQPAETALYRCETESERSRVAILGIEMCNSQPTPRLAERAEPDNLQIRAGALVVEVVDSGIAAVAGVRPGDMIYRVAGVDVPGADDAADAPGRRRHGQRHPDQLPAAGPSVPHKAPPLNRVHIAAKTLRGPVRPRRRESRSW